MLNHISVKLFLLMISVFSEEEPELNNELEISTAETVETIVTQLMEKQRAARAAALNKQVLHHLLSNQSFLKPIFLPVKYYKVEF